jgi:hypothetical protein
MNLGICLSGVEDNFEHALRERAKKCDRLFYCEIGTASCETFLGVHDVLSECAKDFYMIGIDPAKEAQEAYDLKITNKAHSTFINLTRGEAFYACPNYYGNRLDFVFLDGCHSKGCVMADFLEIAPILVKGGLVVFHDIEDEPGDYQPHCKAPRGVREGLQDIGLWQDSRPGWKRLPDWTCDKTKNAFSCACFEKL